MQGLALGLSSLAFQSACGRGGGLVAREHNSCAHAAVALYQRLLGGMINQRQQPSAVQGVEPPCEMPLLLPVGQVLCGSRCGCTDVPLGLLKKVKKAQFAQDNW